MGVLNCAVSSDRESMIVFILLIRHYLNTEDLSRLCPAPAVVWDGFKPSEVRSSPCLELGSSRSVLGVRSTVSYVERC